MNCMKLVRVVFVPVILFVCVGAYGQRQKLVAQRSRDAGSPVSAPVVSTPIEADSPGTDSNVTASPQASAQAIIPRLIKFSGVLQDVMGKPLSGPLDVTFALYNTEGGGDPLWFETQTVQAGQLGHYTALLGTMQPEGLPVDLFTSGEVRWLGIQVGHEQEQQPRVLLVSVPYALKAGDAETLGGKPASAYTLSDSQSPAISRTHVKIRRPTAGTVQGGGSGNKRTEMSASTSTVTPCTMNSVGAVHCLAQGSNQNITLMPSGIGQINLGTTSGFLTSPTNNQSNFGSTNGTQIACLDNGFTGCFVPVLQTSAPGWIYDIYAVASANNATGASNVFAIEGVGYGSGAGTLNQIDGVAGQAEQDGTGTAGEMVAIEAQSNIKTAGTVRTNFGILVDPQTAGTTNYAIYTSGSAPSVFGGSVSALALNNIQFADRYGSDIGAAINAAIAALPASGGIVYSGFAAGMTWTTTATMSKAGVRLILGPALPAYTGTGTSCSGSTNCAIYVPSGVGGLVIEGVGHQVISSGGTKVNVTGNANGIDVASGGGVGEGVVLRDLGVHGPASGTGKGVIFTSNGGRMDGVDVSNMGGNGIEIDGNRGNSNEVTVIDSNSIGNGEMGFYTHGSDGNIVSFIGTVGASNAGYNYQCSSADCTFLNALSQSSGAHVGFYIDGGGATGTIYSEPDGVGDLTAVQFTANGNNANLYLQNGQAVTDGGANNSFTLNNTASSHLSKVKIVGDITASDTISSTTYNFVDGAGSTFNGVLSKSFSSPFRTLNITSNAGAGRWQGEIKLNVGFNAGAATNSVDIKANTDGATSSVDVNGSMQSRLSTVTFSATPTFDASLGNTQTITLTGNVTSSTLSNCATGEFLVFDIIQDATGSRTFVWPANVRNAGTIGSTASKHNIQTFYCDGTNTRATAALLTNQN